MHSIPQWLETWRAGTLAVRERKLGRLVVPSGAIVACDPLTTLADAQPFTRTVSPGRYDVTIGVVEGDVGFALLRLDDAAVITWELARRANDEGIRRPGFGVDAGMACFVDAQIATTYRATRDAQSAAITASMVASPADAEAWHAEYALAQQAQPDPLRALLASTQYGAHVQAMDGGNLIAFTSGVGDGVYPAFWGLDVGGASVVLIIDFGLLDVDADHDSDDDEPEPDVSSRARATRILQRWEREQFVVLTERANREKLVSALVEELAELTTEDEVGAALSEWLMDRGEVAEVFATDEQLEASCR